MSILDGVVPMRSLLNQQEKLHKAPLPQYLMEELDQILDSIKAIDLSADAPKELSKKEVVPQPSPEDKSCLFKRKVRSEPFAIHMPSPKKQRTSEFAPCQDLLPFALFKNPLKRAMNPNNLPSQKRLRNSELQSIDELIAFNPAAGSFKELSKQEALPNPSAEEKSSSFKRKERTEPFAIPMQPLKLQRILEPAPSQNPSDPPAL